MPLLDEGQEIMSIVQEFGAPGISVSSIRVSVQFYNSGTDLNRQKQQMACFGDLRHGECQAGY